LTNIFVWNSMVEVACWRKCLLLKWFVFLKDGVIHRSLCNFWEETMVTKWCSSWFWITRACMCWFGGLYEQNVNLCVLTYTRIVLEEFTAIFLFNDILRESMRSYVETFIIVHFSLYVHIQLLMMMCNLICLVHWDIHLYTYWTFPN
jgi:hypothetical protein